MLALRARRLFIALQLNAGVRATTTSHNHMSLFGRLFRREKPRPAAHQALAMVMLADTDRFSGSAALAHLASHWTDLPSIADAETAGEATTASIPGGAIALMHLPMPIPAVDLEGPVAVAWHWPGAEAAVAAHRSHVIVIRRARHSLRSTCASCSRSWSHPC